MVGLSQDLIPGQTLGKIGYINQCLRIIDPDSTHAGIRNDYKNEITWHNKPLNELYNACKTGQCGDYEELGKKSLVLQELARLVTLIQPQTMSPEVLDEIYQELKKQADLWTSAYHVQLDKLEKLIQTSSKPSLNHSFLNVILAQLKRFISTHGFNPANTELQQFITLASQVQNMIYHHNGNNLELIKNFINNLPYPLNELISIEEEQLFISQLINWIANKLRFQPLTERCFALMGASSMDKDLIAQIDKILIADEQLHVLSTLQLGEHQLSYTEIESLFPVPMDINTVLPIEQIREHTIQQGYVLLLSKAYPHAKETWDRLRIKVAEEINSALSEPEVLHSIIAAEVLNQSKDKDLLTQEAAKQLLEALRVKLNKTQAIEPNVSLIQLHHFLQQQIEQVVKGVEKRKLMIDALGFAVPTFKNVEQVMSDFAANMPQKHPEILQKFYSAIKSAKEQFLCQRHPIEEFNVPGCCAPEMVKEPSPYKKKAYNTLKPIEELNEKDILQFFKVCCEAGVVAAKELKNTRSVGTIIIDVLKMFVNWAIRILSCGKTPQFFKPQTTAVDNLASAVTELKDTLEETLDHLNLDVELEGTVSKSM